MVQKVRNTLNQVAGLLTNWQKVYFPMTISSSVARNEYETKLGNSPARVTLMQQYFRDDLARLKIYYYDLDTTNSLDVSRRAHVLNQVVAQIYAITDYQSAHKLEAYDFIAEAYDDDGSSARRTKYQLAPNNVNKITRISDELIDFGVTVVKAFPDYKRKDKNIRNDLMRIRIQRYYNPKYYEKVRVRLFKICGALEYMQPE